jgi:hypothetical protein
MLFHHCWEGAGESFEHRNVVAAGVEFGKSDHHFLIMYPRRPTTDGIMKTV